MRKIAAMQPYLFPYLGYFQLINAVDEFVLGDVLQYEKESWINRNRILIGGKVKLVTFPLKKEKFGSSINERVFADTFREEVGRLLKSIKLSYSRAANFKDFFPVLEEILLFQSNNLALYSENSIRFLCEYMGITTPIRLASTFGFPFRMEKQERVIQTVKALNGVVYINPIGGAALYDHPTFRAHGLQLRFHRMGDVTYRQFTELFQPSLSIIDVLMFNPPSCLSPLLDRYSLVHGDHHHEQALLTGS